MRNPTTIHRARIMQREAHRKDGPIWNMCVAIIKAEWELREKLTTQLIDKTLRRE